MELQWPLILFTTFVAWCCGTFSTQAFLALKGKGEKIQMTAWIVSAVLLVIGGVAVFFHLQHFERIFNGFGHMTSGITQELIAIVVLAVVAIIYLVMLRRNEGKVPAWIAVCAIVISVILVIVMGHSYMMAARPAWDNILWIVSLLGAACILGPATVMFLVANAGEEDAELGQITFIGAIINAVASILALVSINMAKTTQIGYFFDLTHPTMDITAGGVNAFGGSSLGLAIATIIIGCIAPIVCAYFGKKGGNWKTYAAVAVVCAVIGAICLRAVFYINGVSVFGIY